MQVGDLVKMRLGYSAPGIIIEIVDIAEELAHMNSGFRKYAKVLWSDHGLGLEKRRDLEVVSSLIENDSEDNKNDKSNAR